MRYTVVGEILALLVTLIQNHAGMISGVGYPRLPDNIEQEWENEDLRPQVLG